MRKYITKYYEFVCVDCGNADYPPGKSKENCIKSFRESNGIVTSDEKVFCDKNCFENYKK